MTKRLFDIGLSLFLLPSLLMLVAGLLLLNPFFNRGSLFFVQPRMGHHCRSFRAYKFRTMTAGAARGPNDPLERDRITPLGGFLRRSRLDEVPQILNVLKGDMSLIGPRPDYYDHAIAYLDVVQGYRERHLVRPGISGLAQTEVGYAEGLEATRTKVCADLYYITHTGFALEAWIFWRTLLTVFGRAGA
ncbi:sugar transferase [Thalassovita sp.]|uniref:sugar transferase n=1 Tax=Thalassovita sp. TaxID=1979401 RepID=UPI0029DE83EA|nr:sugar transferase [Thalassovita sp.]